MKDTEPVDISDMPDVRRLVDEAERSDEPLVLRTEGKNVAVLISTSQRRRPAILTEDEIEILRSVAGAWKDFDSDAFIEQIYRDRESEYRPPVDL